MGVPSFQTLTHEKEQGVEECRSVYEGSPEVPSEPKHMLMCVKINQQIE